MKTYLSEFKRPNMLKNVIRMLSIAAAGVAVILIMSGAFGNSSHMVSAEDDGTTFSQLIRDLANVEATIFLEFHTPIAGENAWFIPEDLFVDEQFAGRRLLGEIGADYICVEEIGIGLQTTYCVSHSNIAYVSFSSP